LVFGYLISGARRRKTTKGEDSQAGTRSSGGGRVGARSGVKSEWVSP
jgi:hypothetical protein